MHGAAHGLEMSKLKLSKVLWQVLLCIHVTSGMGLSGMGLRFWARVSEVEDRSSIQRTGLIEAATRRLRRHILRQPDTAHISLAA